MRSTSTALLVALFSVTLFCAVHGTAADKTASSIPARIVALDGPLTEIVYALGLGDRIVGADTTAVWPKSVKKKPSIGYVRNLSAEGIISLNPTLILNDIEAGPPEIIQQLRSSKVPFADIPGDKDSRSFATILKRVTSVAEAIGVPEKGKELAAAIQADLDAAAKVSEGRKRQKLLFIFNPAVDKVFVGGKGTAPNEYAQLLNLENAAAHLENWKPMSPEALIAAAPDLIVIASRQSSKDYATAEKLFSPESLALTPAGKNKRVVFVDLVKSMAGGPRAGEMALEFAQAAYPDAVIPASKSSPIFRAVEAQFPD